MSAPHQLTVLGNLTIQGSLQVEEKTFIGLSHPVEEKKVKMHVLLAERYNHSSELDKLILTDPRLVAKLESLRGIYIPIEQGDETAWIASYLAGFGITPNDFKAGLSEATLDFIISGFHKQFEEWDAAMFIAGFSDSKIDPESEVLSRWNRGNTFKNELIHQFGGEKKAQIHEEFGYFLAGTGIISVTGVSHQLLDELFTIYQALPSSDGSEDLVAFIAGYSQ